MNKKLLENSFKTITEGITEVVTAKHILETDYGPEIWTVDQLIPQGSIIAITGMPGSYKTWLTLDIARCVSTGSNFLGHFKVTKGRILIIDKENSPRYVQKRIRMLGIDNEEVMYLRLAENFLIDKGSDFDMLVDMIKKLKINLVIFDSLVRVHGGDENAANEISKVMGLFRKLTNFGPTVIFIHHNRKESANTKSSMYSVRGSTDILGAIDSLLQIGKGEKGELYVKNSKQRYGEELDTFKVKVFSDKDKEAIAFTYAGPAESGTFEIQEIAEEIMNIMQDGTERSRKELADEFESCNPIIFSEALRILSKVGPIRLKKVVGPHNKHFYVIAKDQPVEKVEPLALELGITPVVSPLV